MLELFRDTGLGYVLGLFSRDESIVLEANSLVWPYPRYEAGAGRRNGIPQNCVVVTDRSKFHRNSQLSNADSAFVEKAEHAEHAEQNCVVGWYGLDDHEVCSKSVQARFWTSLADNAIEPTELVQCEKGVRLHPDFPAEHFHISWSVDLLPRHR